MVAITRIHLHGYGEKSVAKAFERLNINFICRFLLGAKKFNINSIAMHTHTHTHTGGRQLCAFVIHCVGYMMPRAKDQR